MDTLEGKVLHVLCKELKILFIVQFRHGGRGYLDYKFSLKGLYVLLHSFVYFSMSEISPYQLRMHPSDMFSS